MLFFGGLSSTFAARELRDSALPAGGILGADLAVLVKAAIRERGAFPARLRGIRADYFEREIRAAQRGGCSVFSCPSAARFEEKNGDLGCENRREVVLNPPR